MMTMTDNLKTDTLRPGLLVSLKTSVTGGVDYDKKNLDRNTVGDASVVRWETVRTITDPVEHEAATKARSKASSAIRSVCTHSAFGLLCPEGDKDKLEKAVAEARKIADDFNKTSRLSKLSVYVISGRVAPDDEEAVKAIKSEVRELMDDMARAIRNFDPKAIRDAASKAREVSGMLTPDAQARVQIVIDAARTVAKEYVKAGEAASKEVDESVIRKITEQRTAFLDLSDAEDVQAPQEQGRSVDFAPEADKDFAEVE